MSILDKLVERKDLLSYIGLRIEVLRRNKKGISRLPPKKQQKAFMKINGRIKELETTRKVILDHTEKKLSKQYWHTLNDKPEE